MNIRRIEKKDLPMIAELVKDNTIETRDDICFEHSKICLSEDGEILCFIVLRERSLLEFFNGNIPAVENFKGEYLDEWWVKEEIEAFDGKHYEIIAAYLKEGVSGGEFGNLTFAVECDLHDDHYGPQIGVFWTTSPLPYMPDFYHLNNVVWVDFPLTDY